MRDKTHSEYVEDAVLSAIRHPGGIRATEIQSRIGYKLNEIVSALETLEKMGAVRRIVGTVRIDDEIYNSYYYLPPSKDGERRVIW